MKVSMEFDRFVRTFPLTAEFIQSLVHHDLANLDCMNNCEQEALLNAYLLDNKDDDYLDVVCDKDVRISLAALFTESTMSTWNLKAVLTDVIMQTWDQQFDEIFDEYRNQYLEKISIANAEELSDLVDENYKMEREI
jgi:hypothetical protein